MGWAERGVEGLMGWIGWAKAEVGARGCAHAPSRNDSPLRFATQPNLRLHVRPDNSRAGGNSSGAIAERAGEGEHS